MAEFKVGGKVICVKDHPDVMFGKYPIHRNETRTVRAVCFTVESAFGVALMFEETILPNGYNGLECGYDATHFLPLDDFKEVTFEKIKEQVPVGVQ